MARPPGRPGNPRNNSKETEAERRARIARAAQAAALAKAQALRPGPVIVTPPPEDETTTTTTTTNRSGGGDDGDGDGGASAARRRAGQAALDKAKNLQAQIDALKYALETAFKSSLDQNLADVGMVLEQQTNLVKSQSAARAQAFLGAAGDNEQAVGMQQESGFGNLVRERGEIMSGLIQQGAGETDALRAMAMAARNFTSNQQEGNRAYYDTLRTINTGITDLNEDTRNVLSNSFVQAESERERLYQDFYNRRSESFTQLGNVYGQQGDYYADAKEMEVGGGDLEGSRSRSAQAFMDASKEAGKSYEQKPLPAWISDYAAADQVEGYRNNSELGAAVQFERPKKAQGATLRKWAA